MEAFLVSHGHVQRIVNTDVVNALFQYIWQGPQPPAPARPFVDHPTIPFLDAQSPSVLKALYEDLATLHGPPVEANLFDVASTPVNEVKHFKISDNDNFDSSGTLCGEHSQQAGYSRLLEILEPSSSALQSDEPTDGTAPLDPDGQATQATFQLPSAGSPLRLDCSDDVAAVVGTTKESVTSSPKTPASDESDFPQSAETAQTVESSSTSHKSEPTENNHSRLAEAPPLSHAQPSSHSSSRTRPTAADFFDSESGHEDQKTGVCANDFTKEDIDWLLKQEKAAAIRPKTQEKTPTGPVKEGVHGWTSFDHPSLNKRPNRKSKPRRDWERDRKRNNAPPAGGAAARPIVALSRKAHPAEALRKNVPLERVYRNDCYRPCYDISGNNWW
ncbi:MAG: hypothetical protein Q9219_004208 [cf. Caloplaca sp. 3 TL-2023]